ncbi:MAG: ankyrin repeat domain-containing protein [Wolbachia endosymbiont of Tyrophagus putrescentiae]|nr:ankyrin repeat domain-containing protein [Wolbachia endosymbiont of Tyrophagus putrescentiae]
MLDNKKEEIDNAYNKTVTSLEKEKDEIFFTAVEKGDPNGVQVAIDVGADVNIADEDKRTALHFAVQKGLFEVVKLLITKGANIDAKDKDNKTALDIAKRNGKEKIVALLEKAMQPSSDIHRTNVEPGRNGAIEPAAAGW